MFQHILVPLDGSQLAERALSVAARMARTTGASLTLLRVFAGVEELPMPGKGMPMNVSSVFEREREEAKSYIQHIATSTELQGLNVHIQMVQDHPARAILHEVQTSGVDAIVMCSHGRTGMKRWMMGSISRKVVRHSPVPVFLLRPQEDGASVLTQETIEQLRVLIPLDGSLLAEEALAPTIALSKSFPSVKKAELHLVCIVPLFTLQTLEAERGQIAKDAQAYLTSVEQQIRQQTDATDLTITSSVMYDRDGDVAHTIATLAETGQEVELREDARGYNLIAMSTHGRGGLAHWMMGSVTERVLDATKLPVLVVHPKKIEVKHQSEEVVAPEQSWVGLL